MLDIKGKLKTLATLGCSETESEASNRVTIFTNVIVLVGWLMGASLCFQLPALGVPLKFMGGIIGSTVFSGIILYLNATHRRLAARLITLGFSFFIGWNSILVFGETFNGHYIFFTSVVYAILAFSKNDYRFRIGIIVLVISNFYLKDVFHYYNFQHLTGMTSTDLPFRILWTNSALFAIWVAVMVWVEKSKADQYEENLNEALTTIQKSKNKIQVIFDNINHGLMMVGDDLKVDEQYSIHTKNLFTQADPAHQNITEFLSTNTDLSDAQIANLQTSLDFCIGGDEFNWDLNSGHFPSSAEVSTANGHRYLSLSWSPVYDSGVVSSVIVSIEDVTEKKLNEQKVADQKATEQAVESLIQSIAQGGLALTRQFIDDLTLIHSQLQEIQSLQREPLLQRLHGLKGEARILNLQQLAGVIHNLETAITDTELKKLGSKKELQDFLQTSEQLIKASKKLFNSVNSSQGSEWSLDQYIGSLKIKIRHQLKASPSKLTLKMVAFEDGVRQWPPAYRKPVQTILLHAFQNAVDHGYLLQNATDDVKLKLKTYESQEWLHVEIEDFGAGLNLKVIQEKYEDLPASVKQTLHSPTDILFLNDFTTAQVATITSGRGVGLSAIKAEVDRLNGHISITNCEDHRGTRLALKIPKELKSSEKISA